MSDHIFIPADAHEGCVWVPTQQRLYFATTTKLDEPRAAIHFLDFSGMDLDADHDWSSLEAREWIHDANMVNSFCLATGGRSFLVAEQGSFDTPSLISRIDLETMERKIVVDQFRDKPFNSLNKVLVTRHGHLIFTDPDYGFRQGFRPAPAYPPSLYILPKNGALYTYNCNLEMPHGLALSPDERTLFVTDTSNDGAHSEEVDLSRRRSVHLFGFEPESGRVSGGGKKAFSVDEGVPDGSITVMDRVLVGGGDGVYVADLNGKYIGKIELERTAVNLCAVAENRHLFVTADEGVYLIRNWRKYVNVAPR